MVKPSLLFLMESFLLKDEAPDMNMHCGLHCLTKVYDINLMDHDALGKEVGHKYVAQ